jgi:hypothetical protein
MRQALNRHGSAELAENCFQASGYTPRARKGQSLEALIVQRVEIFPDPAKLAWTMR